MGHKKNDPHQRLESLELWSGRATLLILLGIVIEIGLIFWFPRNPSETLGALAANILIGIGLIVEYVVILRAIVASGEATRLSDEQVAKANARASEANAIAAQANEIATAARHRTVSLELLLEVERQQRAPRTLSDQQKSALVSELKGKTFRIILVVQVNFEAQAFAHQLSEAFQRAGISLGWQDMPPGEIVDFPAGVGMYMPGGSRSEDEMKDDPLYLALKKAGLYGGHTAFPKLNFRDPYGPQLLPSEHLVYVGQKAR